MKRADVEDKLRTVVVEQLGSDRDTITDDSKFIEDLFADSLDIVELAMAAEYEFGISIEDDEVDKLETFKDAVDLVCRLVRVDG